VALGSNVDFPVLAVTPIPWHKSCISLK